MEEEIAVNITIPELILSISEKSKMTNEEVAKVIYAFIEQNLKRLNLN